MLPYEPTTRILIAGAAGLVVMSSLLKFAKRRQTERRETRKRATLSNGTYCIVITGATHGLGKHLAHAFLNMCSKDSGMAVRLVLNARNGDELDAVVSDLNRQFPVLLEMSGRCSVSAYRGDISNADTAERLAEFARVTMGCITHWINNAGITQAKRALLTDTPSADVEQVVRVNLIGSLFCTQAALKIMAQQHYGHVFNMEGAGSRQVQTPHSVAYGVSKAGFRQMNKSLVAEMAGTGVGCHLISPGMVMTRLLMKSAVTPYAWTVFNILAQQPSHVANQLAPRIISTIGTGTHIGAYSVLFILWRFLTHWRYHNRYIDERQGNLLVPLE